VPRHRRGLAAGRHRPSDYPSKPIKLVSPFPAGGTSDVMARMLAEEMGKQLKQPVVVENVGGAGGVVGTLTARSRRPPMATR
jgi:tripartite-type tricarboxylate transporter receptor subunit TctC